MLELNDHHLKALIVIVGLGNLRSQPTLHSGPKTQAEEPYCRGRMMKAPKRPKDVAEDDLTLSISQDT